MSNPANTGKQMELPIKANDQSISDTKISPSPVCVENTTQTQPIAPTQYKYSKTNRTTNSPPDRVKYSMGIACCRINDKTHRAELLMVCKRNTYNFVQFVHGSYDPNDSNSVLKLLNGMTRDEKLDILSGNFQQIWYRIWLNTPVNSAYYPARNKYTVLWNETGGKLRALIDRSNNSRLIWELPKGRKKAFSESDLSCAIREFNEETGLSRGSYQLLNLPSKRWVIIDNNTKYISRYFLAGYRGSNQYTHPVVYDTSEISEVRWMDIEQIKIHEPGMYNFAKNLLKIYKKYTRPYVKSKYSIYNQLTSEVKA
nr:mRNA-decapping protein g5R [Faustovirus]